jgi:hypothetical protein
MNLFTLYLFSADTCFHALVGYRYLYFRAFHKLIFRGCTLWGMCDRVDRHLPRPAESRHEVRIDRPAGCPGIVAALNWYEVKLKEPIVRSAFLLTKCHNIHNYS